MEIHTCIISPSPPRNYMLLFCFILVFLLLFLLEGRVLGDMCVIFFFIRFYTHLLILPFVKWLFVLNLSLSLVFVLSNFSYPYKLTGSHRHLALVQYQVWQLWAEKYVIYDHYMLIPTKKTRFRISYIIWRMQIFNFFIK